MELERVGQTFRHQQKFWEDISKTLKQTGEGLSRQVRKGITANAGQQAEMFRSLAVDAEQQRQDVVARHPALDVVL